MSGNLTKIVLVEDVVPLRESLKKMLSEIPDLVMCGEYDTAQSAIEGIDRICPDLAILDIGLKSGNGLEVLRYLNQAHPGCRAMVFSNRIDSEYRQQALLCGATHVFDKFTESEQLFDAVATLAVARSRSEPLGLSEDVSVQSRASKFSAKLSTEEKQCI